MSTVSISRSGRSATWVLVVVLLMAALAPLAVRPPAAAANVCDSLAVGSVCGNDTAAGGVVNSVGSVVGDVASGVAGVVSEGGKWVGANAKGILKAAAVAGIGVGTWVACSKILKVVTTAGAAGAAAAGTGGVGSVAGGAAGLAASAAVCKLVRKGGQVVLKVAKGGLKTGGKLAGIAKLAAAATGFAALVYGVEHAASWVLMNLLDLDRQSAPNLGATWLTDLRSQLNGTAAVLLLFATILALTFAGATGRVSDVGRIFSSMVGVALIIGVVGALLLAALQMSDAVTAETMKSPWGQRALGNWTDLGDSYAGASPVKDAADAASSATGDAAGTAAENTTSGTPQDDGKGPWVVRLLIAVVTAFCGALVWLEMMIRDALLYLLLAFGGLLLAGYPFPQTKHLAQRFGMTLLGVVIAKPVIVITLLIGGSFMQNAAGGQADDGAIIPLLQGAGLMALAACMGWAILAWFNVHGVGAMAGVGARIRGASFGGGRGGGRASGADGPNDPEGPDGSGAGSGPASSLARDVGDRVGGGDAAAGADAAALEGSEGQVSDRLQQAQAREAAGGGNPPASSGLVPATVASGWGAADSNPVDASSGQNLDGAGSTAATATPSTGDASAAAPTEQAPTMAQPDGPVAGGDARAGLDSTTASPSAPEPLDQASPTASGPGSASTTAATNSTPNATGGDLAPNVGAPPVGPVPTVPIRSSAPAFPVSADGSGQIGVPPSGEAHDAFGGPPSDAADAFGEHASSIRDMLAANRALGRA